MTVCNRVIVIYTYIYAYTRQRHPRGGGVESRRR